MKHFLLKKGHKAFGEKKLGHKKLGRPDLAMLVQVKSTDCKHIKALVALFKHIKALIKCHMLMAMYL